MALTSTYNMATAINDSLREEPVEYIEMVDGIKELEEIIKGENDELLRAKFLSNLGYYQNLIEEFDAAILNLQQALNVFRSHKAVGPTIIAKIRLAQVYQYSGDLETGLAILESIEVEDEFAHLEDLVLYHKAIILHESKDHDKALEYLSELLETQEEIGDKAKIHKTLFAIKAILEKTEN
jgi:tetratricopeptide (TPR) repeat protein